MQTVENDRRCETCIHFTQHYFIRNGKLRKVFCGICANGQMRKGEKKKQLFHPDCPHWEEGGQAAVRQKQGVREAFAKAADALAQIALILEEEAAEAQEGDDCAEMPKIV